LVDTKNRPVGGGKNYPVEEAAQGSWLENVATATGLPIERLARLFDRYGTRAESIAQFIAMAEDFPLKCQPGYSQREIQFIVEQEKVVHLLDFIQRRSLLAMTGRVTKELLAELAEIIGETLGWTKTRSEAEIRQAVSILRDHHGVNVG
jgi:glycerol-3-phosphate dehydrogenase